MKTTYERFIEANHRLIQCFEGIPVDRYNSMSVDEQNGLCQRERDTVAGFLTNNQVGFANILKERLESINGSSKQH